ncbi:MAG: phage holin [Atopostipes sp.]|nr:phage holin [Atopostipes sp.]
MELKNESYDRGKWMVLIFLPAIAVLVGGLSDLYQWPNGSLFVGTINLLTVFLGSVLQVSSETYYSDDDWGGGTDDTCYY